MNAMTNPINRKMIYSQNVASFINMTFTRVSSPIMKEKNSKGNFEANDIELSAAMKLIESTR